MSKWSEPAYTTGMAAAIIGVNPKTLINYDNWGIFTPSRSKTKRRLYSREDLYELLAIRYLLGDRKLTINGVKFALELIALALDKGVDLRDAILPDEIRRKIEDRIS